MISNIVIFFIAVPLYTELYIIAYILSIYFNNILLSILAAISHNVPAVYDGLAARISKCTAFPGPTNCAGAMAWE
jgi:hypothetical protein